jgi:hypothetical protein
MSRNATFLDAMATEQINNSPVTEVHTVLVFRTILGDLQGKLTGKQSCLEQKQRIKLKTWNLLHRKQVRKYIPTVTSSGAQSQEALPYVKNLGMHDFLYSKYIVILRMQDTILFHCVRLNLYI